jgi:hypothetical protein
LQGSKAVSDARDKIDGSEEKDQPIQMDGNAISFLRPRMR